MQRTYPLWLAAAMVLCGAAVEARADAWPMKHRDMYNTGRADFVVPAERMGGTFFDVLRWQTPTPSSPNEGNLSSTAMVFFDGSGPGGIDLVAGGYHWPKGVQGMDRHTGRYHWHGLPAGGESIGANTPAFAPDGGTLYVTNDATSHPLMAFDPAVGVSPFWHNGNDANPGLLGAYSPIVADDGRIFTHSWNDRPYGATDYGTQLRLTWSAESSVCTCYSNPALYYYLGELTVVATGRCGVVKAFDGATGWELWSMPTGQFTDANPTIDPVTGSIYFPVGSGAVGVVGLDADGFQLWAQTVMPVDSGNPHAHRAQSTGCLSHDGATFYFQTNNVDGFGKLFAIDTATGGVKWALETGSRGGEMWSSSPIVTPNGVIVLGNNDGGAYLAVRDAGTHAELLDVFAVADGASARATPTLSADGLLYLPLRTIWLVSNGSGAIPTFETANVFSCFDLNAGATTQRPPPPGQTAVAHNAAVRLTWRPIIDPHGQFSHYAVYRATAPFEDVSAMTPIATVAGLTTTEYIDATAQNGVSYHYALTTVSQGGGEVDVVQSIGPRTPRDETDLQVSQLSRTPRYPRYLPNYTYYTVTEPSGFGPYGFSAATGLGGGQTAQTPRWPNVGDPVTYTATVRNRGTNPWVGTLGATAAR